MEQKTNVMRILDKAKIPYQAHNYTGTGAISGPEVAAALKQDPARVFKTLVTVGKSRQPYVFVIPVCRELDLKKAAACVGEKAVDMLPQRDLLKTTGYIHGGCSPVGMKKAFPTVFDASAAEHDTICFSGGKVGYQVELNLNALASVLEFRLGDLTVEE